MNPFEKAHFDLWDAGSSDRRGKRYLLAVTDELTKYTDGIALPNKRETVVAEAMLTLIFRHGIFGGTIITDNGREWSSIWKLVTEKLEIRHIRSAPYNSHANSPIERRFRDFNTLLRCNDISRSSWSEHLPFALFVLNNRPKEVLGQLTPSECLFGRSLALPLDIETSKIDTEEDCVRGLNKYINCLHSDLMKLHFDRYNGTLRKNQNGCYLRPGDKVFVYTPKVLNGKFTTSYTGPLTIVRQLATNTYECRCDATGTLYRRNIRHMRRYMPDQRLEISS